ncbi:sulfatase-like hydrolase/transferase [Aureibacter tunicatorum]|uniref:Arylsulfatase A-like enzyme n=1 Tax=Aureibacter tunicatorum TaxID=866807 RepID=A0AAE3XTL3_9BACT|nr:sulfatase-like hydrolase/transferase [Aureibacter tunicatorum]MDR6241754.1 arylsulfatase A-like enzyme [Aureibacter tunicatorum]BDD07385.1 N-acetylgalactosamine-6-sulfatase [Aureibacter tunicatorum]
MNKYTRKVGYSVLMAVMGVSTVHAEVETQAENEKPNIILIMTDDQGWGDTGYNGHEYLKTPSLDQMAEEGILFNRFYASSPVSSPTRASCLTGRHPYRYGIYYANRGYLKKEEYTLAELLKDNGYRTGHFGKWHLGTLTKSIRDANRGGKEGNDYLYSPPWENGYDDCFVTESKVPTWDPMKNPDPSALESKKGKAIGEFYGTHYWDIEGNIVKDNLEGDDSRVIMDRVIPFIDQSVDERQPFFSVIWFHASHTPVLTGGKYLDMYEGKGLSDDQKHFYGTLTAMDEQVGRLREKLSELGVDKNTIIYFCSDNGPAGNGDMSNRWQGTTSGLKGRKKSLHEGGVRVPGLMVWPARIKERKVINTPMSTLDYYPTICDILNIKSSKIIYPLDGVSMMDYIDSSGEDREKPIGFQSIRGEVAWMDNEYKLYRYRQDSKYELFDIVADPNESIDIIKTNPKIAKRMIKALEKWQKSCIKSDLGHDY